MIFRSVPHWCALRLANLGPNFIAEFVCDERAPQSNLSKGVECFFAAPHCTPCLLGKGPDRIPATWIRLKRFFDPMFHLIGILSQ